MIKFKFKIEYLINPLTNFNVKKKSKLILDKTST